MFWRSWQARVSLCCRMETADQHEETGQAALFQRAAYKAGQGVELAYMFRILNGGLRSKVTTARLKTAGVKPGVPDNQLLATRGNSAEGRVVMWCCSNKQMLVNTSIELRNKNSSSCKADKSSLRLRKKPFANAQERMKPRQRRFLRE